MNPTHVHLALNHVPVIGTGFGLLVLLYGVLRRSEEIQRLALAVFLLVGLSLVPVRFSGERAEEAVEHLPGITESVVERHEDAAGLATGAAFAIALVALAGLVAWRRHPVPRWFTSGVLALAVLGAGLMAWTANLGGQVRHTEIRAGGDVSAASSLGHESHDDE